LKRSTHRKATSVKWKSWSSYRSSRRSLCDKPWCLPPDQHRFLSDACQRF
jgi:hypothetical protein